MRYAKSLSGRTIWTVVEGRLNEENPANYTFKLTATDTYILALLLSKCQDEIKAAAMKEAGDEHKLNALLGNLEADRQLLPEG